MSSGGRAGPRVEIYNTQEKVAIDLERLRAVAGKALPLCLARALADGDVLTSLEEVEVSIVDDASIAEVHGEFLGDPTATDVITFEHGEILISAETATARAAEFGNEPDRELALYLIHGLLHLAGYLDTAPTEFELMRDVQETVLTEVW